MRLFKVTYTKTDTGETKNEAFVIENDVNSAVKLLEKKVPKLSLAFIQVEFLCNAEDIEKSIKAFDADLNVVKMTPERLQAAKDIESKIKKLEQFTTIIDKEMQLWCPEKDVFSPSIEEKDFPELFKSFKQSIKINISNLKDDFKNL